MPLKDRQATPKATSFGQIEAVLRETLIISPINKQKIKIDSRDDRRRGITINDFTIFLPEGYIYKNNNIEIKIYGANHDVVLIVSARIIMALREKIKEIEDNKVKK